MPRPGISEMINLARVLATGRLMHHGETENSFTTRFERRLRAKIGVKHALTVNSGTSALIVALVAAGVGPGDEVLVPAYTWVSTAAAPLAVGAIPILVDIDETLTMDPIDLERKITPRAKAIIPVHMLNLVCNMCAIIEIAKRYQLLVIEDACQALGVSYKGRRVGSVGDLGTYSFNYYKNISAGEGGAVVTNSDRYSERARVYHDIGTYSGAYETAEPPYNFIGVNLRVSELTGAVLCAQLERLETLIKRLRRRRKVFASLLSQSGRFTISPHNDLENAAGLTINFDRSEDAEAFANSNPSVMRVIDIRRHAYVDWISVLSRYQIHERMKPAGWLRRDTYSNDMCSRTLDILRRTCLIPLRPERPLIFLRAEAGALLRAAAR